MSKDICDCNSHMSYQQCYLLCTKVPIFVTTFSFEIWSADRSLGDVKKMKSCKISVLGTETSSKQIIVYTDSYL